MVPDTMLGAGCKVDAQKVWNHPSKHSSPFVFTVPEEMPEDETMVAQKQPRPGLGRPNKITVAVVYMFLTSPADIINMHILLSRGLDLELINNHQIRERLSVRVSFFERVAS